MVRDKAWLKNVRKLRCICTGAFAHNSESVDPAHIGTAGKGIKSGDDEVIPLLHSVHLACHQQGEVTVIRSYLIKQSVQPLRMQVCYYTWLRHQGFTTKELCELHSVPFGDWSITDVRGALRAYARWEYITWLNGSQPFVYAGR